MTAISPLLESQLKSKNKMQNNQMQSSAHEAIYEKLRKHANDVHPNAPKARLVNENPFQSAVSYVKDSSQDFVNLKNIIKTGKTSDNNLGRLNDLGMKIGALAIASFLALNSKNKHEAIMRFVGTGAFFASMKLWPKIFINTPAKIIHGVDPGKKYISAQGDKKDFYLDNQFLPWDITNIKDEKEQRRHQKVALQNRTLWMATAGAGVPLMTALISNRIEPVVSKAMLASGMKKAKKNAANLKGYIESAPAILRNEREVKALCEQYANDPFSPEFAKKLKEYLKINQIDFQDGDWTNPIKDYSITDFENTLTELWKEKSKYTCSVAELKDKLSKMTTAFPSLAGLISKDGEISEGLTKTFANIFEKDSPEIDRIISSLSTSKDGQVTFTYKELEKAIGDARKEIVSSGDTVQKWLKSFNWDDKDFFGSIQAYNRDVVASVRGRLRRFLKLSNPIVGNNANSVYTNAYSRTMHGLFNKMGCTLDSPKPLLNNTPDFIKIPVNKAASFISNGTAKITDFVKFNILRKPKDIINANMGVSIEEIVKQDNSFCRNVLSNFFQNIIKDKEFGSDKYNEVIKNLLKDYLTENETNTASIFASKESIETVLKTGLQPTLDKSVFGDKNSSLVYMLSKYTSEQKTNIDSIVARLGICANFEARLKEGKIQIDGVDLKEIPSLLQAAKSIIYEGNVSQTVINNSAGIIDKSKYMKLIEALFSPEAFKDEPELMKQSASKIFEYITKNSDFKATDKYLANTDLTALVKDYAQKIYPNMKWLKKAGIAAAILVAVTLLVQPFFGNIKKEFPKENKKEKGGSN